MVNLVPTALCFNKVFATKNMCHNFHFAYIITALPQTPHNHSFFFSILTSTH